MKLLATILLAIFIQGCSVFSHKTDDYLTPFTPSNTKTQECNIQFAIDIKSEFRQHTTGTTQIPPRAEKERQLYVSSTKQILSELGCTSNFVGNINLANFVIEITRSPYLSALPQEWLTGLSFGVIPSWGTRHSEYQYNFLNKINSTAQEYSVDTVSVNHIILFPLLWTNLFMPQEIDVYKKSLNNFILASPRTQQTSQTTTPVSR